MSKRLIGLVIFFLFWRCRFGYSSVLEDKAKLKVDCFQCHQKLKEQCADGVAHWATAKGDCCGCHNPHTAKLPYLLLAEGSSLCYQCHLRQQEKWEKKLSIHLPIQKEGCLVCHDAHVSPYRYQLKALGQSLCFRCHDPAPFRLEYVHQPVSEGNCHACHAAHASDKKFLLIGSSQQMCLKCHGQKELSTSHEGFEVKQSECIVCHNPHASNLKGLLYHYAHQPYKEKKCHQCHQVNKEPKRMLIAKGATLCYTCHPKKKNFVRNASRNHLTTGDNECIYCHNPHAADRKNFIRKDDRTLCVSCHQQMGERLKSDVGPYRHPEVVKGNCSYCHDAHASSYPKFYKADILLLCTGCHTRQKVARHPVGDKVIDPRDRKSPVKCDTCHNPMGTEFKNNLRFDGSQSLCQQCHHK